MRILLGRCLGWLHSGGREKIGPTTRLGVTAGLRVGAAVGNPEEIDTALVAEYDLRDTIGSVDGMSGVLEIDDDRTDDGSDNTDEIGTDDEASWQHRTASSGCIAGRIARSDKDYGTLGAKDGGRMAGVAE